MPFNGITNLRDANETFTYKPWQLIELKKCAQDPIYFINTYVYINTKDYGMQLFKTWKFQDNALNRFVKYRFNINRWSRQVGKSTVVRGFILWYSIFHKDKLTAMLANKLMLAKEQLQLLRDSYIALPMWLQPGVKLWNKMSIQFSNGSRIVVAATSSDGIRGLSPNLLYLDEFAFIRPNMAELFMNSVFPSISSGKTTKVIITSTPNGLNAFYRMWEKAVDESTATPEQLQVKYVRSTVIWNEVPDRTNDWGEEEKLRIGEQSFLQEYECQFIGSSITLIDYKILQTLKAKDPMVLPYVTEEAKLFAKNCSVRLYYPPEQLQKMEANGWLYVASIDTGYGIRKDYHVLQICLTKSNIKAIQVASVSSNVLEINDFCAFSYKILKLYYNPPLIIEYNGPGQMTYSIFFNTFQYPNLVNFDKYCRGLYVTNQLKQNAILLMKTYIQRGYAQLTDDNTIQELMSYTQLTQHTWGASGGNHDDHVSSLGWILFYMASTYYYGNNEPMDFMLSIENILLTEDMKKYQTDAMNFIADKDAVKEQLSLGAFSEHFSEK